MQQPTDRPPGTPPPAPPRASWPAPSPGHDSYRHTQPAYRGPTKAAHGGGYWLTIGWWWEPLKWLGRISLWLLFWPIGLWRSMRHGRKNREARQRRGYR